MQQLRSDCGDEYKAVYFMFSKVLYCGTVDGIIKEFLAPATPSQQNGISERAGRTPMNIPRVLLRGAALPSNLRGEVCCSAAHIFNRGPRMPS